MTSEAGTPSGDADHGAPDPEGSPRSDTAGEPRRVLARIAVYASTMGPPVIHSIESAPDHMAHLLTESVDRLAHDLRGARPPRAALQAVLENLVHAGFRGVTVSIAQGGSLIRVADRGPGIVDKQGALRLGFTTADDALRKRIDGVGAGLPLARRLLEEREGSLEIEDNIDGGTVVTLEVPAAPTAEAAGRPTIQLDERQLRAILMVVELQPVGPTALARELGVSSATAYRDLVELERLGLVVADASGRRSVTEDGLEQISGML